MKIHELKERVSVEDLVVHLGGDVQYAYGGWAKVLCPFHDDRRPSAEISPDGDFFRCWACGVKGDVVDLAKVAGKTDTRGAIAWLQENLLTQGGPTTSN